MAPILKQVAPRFSFLTFVLDTAGVHPFRNKGDGNGRYADESPFLFRVFYQFADDKWGNSRRAQPNGRF